MSLKKKCLVISIVVLMLFTLISFNLKVSATQLNLSDFEVGGGNNTDNEIPIEPATPTTPVNTNQSGNSNSNQNVNANVNEPEQLANTGAEDLPWVIIAICVVSAIFAYKKIKEYKNA